MKLTTARELVQFASSMAVVLFDKDGKVKPLWHAVRRNGEHGVIAPDAFEDGAHKDVVAAAMRAVFEQMDVVAYVFMCESWLRMGGREIDLNAVMRDGLSNDPQKVECVWFTAEDSEGSVSAYQMIERPDGPDGRGVLQPIKWLDRCSRTEGRFVGMLPTTGMTKQ